MSSFWSLFMRNPSVLKWSTPRLKEAFLVDAGDDTFSTKCVIFTGKAAGLQGNSDPG